MSGHRAGHDKEALSGLAQANERLDDSSECLVPLRCLQTGIGQAALRALPAVRIVESLE
jgi:hypothetical protein